MKRARVSPPPVPSLPGVNPALEGTIAHLMNSRAAAESPLVPNVADIVAEMVSEKLLWPEMTFFSDDRKEGLSQWPPKFSLPALYRSLRCSHSDARTNSPASSPATSFPSSTGCDPEPLRVRNLHPNQDRSQSHQSCKSLYNFCFILSNPPFNDFGIITLV